LVGGRGYLSGVEVASLERAWNFRKFTLLRIVDETAGLRGRR
jgi:hypothetical protein